MSCCTFPVRCFGLYTDGCRCREIAGGIPSVGWANCNCPSFECQSVPQCSAVFLEMQRVTQKTETADFPGLTMTSISTCLILRSFSFHVPIICHHVPVMFLSCFTTVHFPGSTVVPRRQLMLRRVWADLPQLLPIEGDMPSAARCVGAVGGFTWVNRQKWGIHHQKWMWHIILIDINRL